MWMPARRLRVLDVTASAVRGSHIVMGSAQAFWEPRRVSIF